jgi:hypothetical protein
VISGDKAERDAAHFSLVLGGPLYQMFRRAHLTGSALDLVRRRIIVIAGIAWVPLLVLSLVAGQAWGGGIQIPFLRDAEAHVRFLVALPLLIVAELVVHLRMRPVVQEFLDRGLVPDDARGRFDDAINSAIRLRNSVGAEVLLIAFVYIVGVGVFWRTQVALDLTTWYGVPVDGRLQPSPAGWWLGLVSLPFFQFLLLRWYWRIIIWTRFLWQVSRIKLQIIPAHPDRAGGMGFLSTLSYAFGPLLVAQGCLLAGLAADRILFAGAKLPEFRPEIVALVALMVFAVLVPTLVFSPQLANARRVGLREYGELAQRYVREFDQKWLRGGAPKDEAFVGSADVQSLADLGNSYEMVTQMRSVPFTLRTALQLAVFTLLPLLPLTLTMFSVDELVQRLLKIVF